MSEMMEHHGILGQKWGIRRTPAQLGNLSKKDANWVKKKSEKITEQARRKSSKEMSRYANEILRSPGAVKRGEVGVMMALADEGYNMAQLRNGVWASGRVAYKKTVLDKA